LRALPNPMWKLPKTWSTKAIFFATVAICIAFGQVARYLNHNIGYANDFNCDSWYFFGLQFDFSKLYATGLYYQAYRFPALLPWNYLGNVIPYEALNAAKFLTYYVVTCFGVMWFSVRLYNTRVAALTTIMFCCSTSFLGALSHDYVTAAGLAWITLWIGSTVEAGRARRVLIWSIVSGVFLGLALYTHLPTGYFVFAVPLFFFAGRREAIGQAARQFPIYIMGSVIGFAAITAVLGLYNVSLGGTFFYLSSQIDVAIHFLEAKGHVETGRAAATTLFRTEGIVPLILTMIGGSALLLTQERRRLIGNAAGLAALVCLITSTFVVVWELIGRIVLQTNVYGPWIYPVLFACIGGMLSRVDALQAMSRQAFAGLVALIVCASLLASVTTRSPATDNPLRWVKVVLGICFLLMFLLLAKTRYGALVLVPIATLIVLNFPTSYGSTPWYKNTPTERDMTFQAAKAMKILTSNKLDVGEAPAFWVGASEPEVIAVPRSFLNCGLFAGSFPSLAAGDEGFEPSFQSLTRKSIGSANTLIVVAPGSKLAQTSKRALKMLGFDSKTIGEWPIGSGRLQTSMAVLRLSQAQK